MWGILCGSCRGKGEGSGHLRPGAASQINDSHTHDLSKLVRIAGLEIERSQAGDASDDFKLNWATVKDWTEDSRYEQRNEAEAKAIIEAIQNVQFGVMQWITQHW